MPSIMAAVKVINSTSHLIFPETRREPALSGLGLGWEE